MRLFTLNLVVLAAAIALPGRCVAAEADGAKAAAQPIMVIVPDHAGPVDFEREILPILNTSCLACHNRTKAKAHLVLETPEDMQKGGSSGAAIVPGHGAQSLLLQAASHAKDDLVMPPPDNKVAAPDLTPQQLGLFRLWIDQGAQGKVRQAIIRWQPLPRDSGPIYAVALTPGGQFAACGRENQVFIYCIPTRQLVATLVDPRLLSDPAYNGVGVAHRDIVNAIAFCPDGDLLATAGYRQIKLWRRARNVRRLTIAEASPAKILALAASPNGRSIAIGDSEGRIQLRAADGKVVAELTGHTGAVNALCFAPDGSRLASASADGTARIWASDTAKQIALVHAGVSLAAVAWALDGKRLVTGGEDKIIRVWQLGADEPEISAPLKELSGHNAAVTSLAALPSAPAQILSGSADGSVRLWNIEEGKELRRFEHGGPVTAVAVRPDGSRFASAGLNNLARLWNLADGKVLAEMKGDRYANDLVAARERDMVRAAGEARYRRSTLDVAVAQEAAELDHVKKSAEGALAADKSLTDKQKALAAANEAKNAADKVLADVTAELKVATEKRDNADKAMKQAAASARDAANHTPESIATTIEELVARAFAAGQAKAAFDAVAAQAPQRQKEAADRAAASAKAATDAQSMLAAALSGRQTAEAELQSAVRQSQLAADALAAAQAAAQNAETTQKAVEKEAVAARESAARAEKPPRAIAFSPDGILLAVAGDDRAVHTYSADDGAAIETCKAQDAVCALTFANGLLLSAGPDRNLTGWDLGSEWRLERVLGSDDAASPIMDRVNALDFSPDGQQLASGGGVPTRSGEIKIWQVSSGDLLRSFDQVHSDAVLSIAYSPDGTLLASGAADRFMKVIDPASGRVIRSFEGHTHHVLGVCWKRDGRTIATCGADNVVKVWDSASGQRLKNVEGFGKEVTSIHYLADTNQLIATSGDGSARIVSDEGAAVRGLRSDNDFLNCSAITPDGRLIAIGSQDGTLHLWAGPTGGEAGDGIRTHDVSLGKAAFYH